MNIDINLLFQKISNSLRHYYGIDVTVKVCKGINPFPISYIMEKEIHYNQRAETILSLYNRSMYYKENIGESVLLYMLFNVALELDDYSAANRYLKQFEIELVKHDITSHDSSKQEDEDGILFLQIFFILYHEAFHFIFCASEESMVSAFSTSKELLKDMETELFDLQSLISNEELLSHPKTKKHIRSLIPSSLSSKERDEMESLLLKEMSVNPYSVEYIDSIINDCDSDLLEEITCDRQAWLNLMSSLKEDNPSPEDILQFHQIMYVAFCAVDFNNNVQSKFDPHLRGNYKYDPMRIIVRHRAFKNLLRQYNPESFELVTDQYLNLNQGLESIYRESISGISKYADDFANLYNSYQNKSHTFDRKQYCRLDAEMKDLSIKMLRGSN